MQTDKPAAECHAQPGEFAPRVDPRRCEGKAECVAVCPYGVFEMGRIADADFRALSVLGKLKSLAHGRRIAHTPHADACQSCGLCVAACPEDAIRLVRVAG